MSDEERDKSQPESEIESKTIGGDPVSAAADTGADSSKEEEKEDGSDGADRSDGSDEEEDRASIPSDAPWAGAEKDWIARVRAAREAASGAGNGSGNEEMVRIESESQKHRDREISEISEITERDVQELKALGHRSIIPLAFGDEKDGKGETAKKVFLIGAGVAVAGIIAFWIFDMYRESVQAKTDSAKLAEELAARNRQLMQLDSAQGGKIKDLEDRLVRLSEIRSEASQAEMEKVKSELNKVIEEVKDTDASKIETNGKDANGAYSRQWKGAKGKGKKEGDGPFADNPYAGGGGGSGGNNPYDDNPYGGAAVASNQGDDLSKLTGDAVYAPPRAASRPEYGGGAVAAVQGSDIPETPSREQVKSVMDAVAANVKRCGGGQGGQIQIKASISGATGRVTSAAAVDPKFTGTPVGNCAASAVRLVKFPRFKQATLIIKYPYDL